MTAPTARLELDLTDPHSTFAGQVETSYLRRFSVARGRSSELDQQQAGRAMIVLDNRDGSFDPVNASGRNYPNLLPMRRVRISVDVGSGPSAFTARLSSVRSTHVLRGGPTTTFTLFTGFVTSWHQEWDPSNGDALCVIDAIDGFTVLAMADFIWGYRRDSFGDFICGLGTGDVVPAIGPPFVPDDLAGDRIERVLDCIDWSPERALDAGTVTILGNNGSDNYQVNEGALQHLLKIADTEGGWLFMDGLGQLRFIDADHDTSLDEFDVYGGQGTEHPYLDISAPFDDSRLWNEITVESPAVTHTASDEASIKHYFSRPKTIDLLPAAGAVLDARADEFLARYKNPTLRLLPLRVTADDDAGWRRLLSKELVDKIRVRKRPAGADMVEQDCRIEGISIDSPNGAELWVQWSLSALETFFHPGDPGGLVGWYDAAALTGLSDADSVTTWPDASGNGNDVTQGTAANKPTYQTNELNGRPVVRFDGTDDRLKVDFLNGLTGLDEGTLIAVLKQTPSGSRYAATFSNDGLYIATNASSHYLAACAGNVGYSQHRLASVVSTWTLVSNVTDMGLASTEAKLWVGGTPGDTRDLDSNNTGTFPVASFFLGCSYIETAFFNGDIAEVLIYDHALSDDDREAVEAYLTAKWGL